MATVLALVFAAIAAVAARRTYSIESERDRVNMLERHAQVAYSRRTQAALVSVWWGSKDGRWGAYVCNASETPVYQAHLTILDPDMHGDAAKTQFPVVPPCADAEFFPIAVDDHSLVDSAVRRVKLSFTDAAGVRWIRTEHGRLIELPSGLRIRADPDRADVLTRFHEDFRAAYGVTITFETAVDSDPLAQFLSEAGTGQVVDGLICPHDWIGSLSSREAIDPIVLSAQHRAAFPPWVLRALTFDNRLWGLPMTVDTVALVRNTALAPEIPATFEEMTATGRSLFRSGRVSEVLAVRVSEHGDPFQIWPLFTSAGGWLFGRDAHGDWDPGVIGLASPESVRALDVLRELGEAGTEVLRRSMDREKALDSFARGDCAFLITTSDGLAQARANGIPIAVSGVPPFTGGAPATPFALVHGLVASRRGANKITAEELFAEYLSHPSVMDALSSDIGCPVAMSTTGGVRDSAIERYSEICGTAPVMPSFPNMWRVWRILGQVEAAVVAGESAEEVARWAAKEVANALSIS
ncbi:sugar ABC transporter substrate-binding protein [Streptomyces specialis]|uniref:sugar ABC transporter substrate-binding protein n=1 Tax=Streptomyces specialis TaxID=498367 RepID=UPI000A9F7DD1|nr:extracellular solute-binding protein [Streptomyces specialis]